VLVLEPLVQGLVGLAGPGWFIVAFHANNLRRGGLPN
jgi:hypothetical protein